MSIFYSTPIAILGPVCIIVAVLVAIGGLALFHRRVDRAQLREANDVAGFIYAVVGVIYAVLLAFVVIVVWEQFREADHVSQDEACHLGNLERLAVVFPDSIHAEIDARVLDYMKSVVEREWPAMADGHEDPQTYLKMERIWRTYYRYQPTSTQATAYDQSLRELSGFTTSRRLRVISSTATIPPILWVLLLGGGIVCIVFTYLFATPKTSNQYWMTGLLAAIIALTLFLIIAMDRPFAGEVRVIPDAFEYLIVHQEHQGEAILVEPGRFPEPTH